MTELDHYKAFFKAWEELQAIPAKPGRPSMEREAAAQLVTQCAEAIRAFKPTAKPIDPVAQEFVALRQQIMDIPPKDTRAGAPNKSVTVLNG